MSVYTTNVPLFDRLKVRIPSDALIRRPPHDLADTAWTAECAAMAQCDPQSANADQFYIRTPDLLDLMTDTERERWARRVDTEAWIRLDLVTLPLSAGLVSRIVDGAHVTHGGNVEAFLDIVLRVFQNSLREAAETLDAKAAAKPAKRAPKAKKPPKKKRAPSRPKKQSRR